MPWNNGTFTRTNGVNTGATVWNQDAAQGTKIVTSRHDTHDQDLADGINACVQKSATNSGSGAGYNITNSGIGYGIFVTNSGSGYGTYVSNTGGGVGSYIISPSGIGLSIDTSTGTDIVTTGKTSFAQVGYTPVAVAQSGASITVNLGQGHINVTLISSAALTLSFTAPGNPGFVALTLIAPGSGTSPTLTWPATILGGTASTTALGLGKKRTLSFYYDGAKYLYINSTGDY